MAQPGSATVLGTVGREFESRRPDHIDHIEINTKVDRCPFVQSFTQGSKQQKISFFDIIGVNKKIFFFLKIFVDPRVVYRASYMSGVYNINM